MNIGAILHHKGHAVTSVSPRTRITELVATLAEHRIGAVLVRDAAGQVLGIVSERDVVRFLARDGAAVLDMTAAQLMTSTLHTVTPSATVAEAMARMTENRVRHLPVLDQDALVGMVSIGDVVLARLEEQARDVDDLKAYVAGNM
jgi:CBS domain-containing protein